MASHQIEEVSTGKLLSPVDSAEDSLRILAIFLTRSAKQPPPRSLGYDCHAS